MSESTKSQEPNPQSPIEKFSMVGYREVDGQRVQVSIGEIDVGDKQVSIEVLTGCSKAGLLDTIQKVAQETGKLVQAMFSGQKVMVAPESQTE